MLKISPDDKIAEVINLLNSKQREVFNVVHTRAKVYVKYDGHKDQKDPERPGVILLGPVGISAVNIGGNAIK